MSYPTRNFYQPSPSAIKAVNLMLSIRRDSPKLILKQAPTVVSLTSSPSKWNQLPSHILQNIFQYVRSSPQHSISTLKASIVVCKDWMKPAQQVFYEHVYLNEDNFSSFIVKTQSRKSTLRPTNTFDPLEIVFFCQELSEIHGAKNPTLQQPVWSCYLKANNQDRLRRDELRALYSDVALKYMDTRTELQVSIGHSGCPLRNPHTDLALVYKLPLFQSLKSLRVTSFEENNLSDLDFLIDSCGSKVDTLSFDSLKMLPSSTPVVAGRPNKTIKSLAIHNAQIPASHFFYLSRKLQALDNLQLKATTIFHSMEEEAEWWRQLNQLCWCLTKYSIQFNSCPYPALISAFTELSDSAKVKQLTVSMNTSHSFQQSERASTTYLFKDNTTVKLFLENFSVSNFENEGFFVHYYRYMPNIISIDSENMRAIYNLQTVRMPQPTPSPLTRQAMSRYFPSKAVTCNLRHQLASKYNDRNWCCLDAAVQMINVLHPSTTIHLGRMVLCDFPPTLYQRCRRLLQLTHMYLKNSIIYYKVLDNISEILPFIHHLTIDTCSILMEEQYSIRISLPFTTLKSLRYKVAPFLYAAGCDDDVRRSNETSNLENEDLLHVVETNGGLLFKIETDNGIYTIRKRGDMYIPVSGSYRHLTSGTQDLFLILVKCKDLDELIFDSNGKSSVAWKKRAL
ncbi:hypothetical protein MBANPS3_004042 [Mucor bainieri]